MGVKFNSNGKLLLSGEYLVLKGAKSLSIPTRFSQTLEVSNNASGKIKWESYDQNKKIWFDLNFDLNQEWNLKSFKENKLLFKTLSAIKIKNPDQLRFSLFHRLSFIFIFDPIMSLMRFFLKIEFDAKRMMAKAQYRTVGFHLIKVSSLSAIVRPPSR